MDQNTTARHSKKIPPPLETAGCSAAIPVRQARLPPAASSIWKPSSFLAIHQFMIRNLVILPPSIVLSVPDNIRYRLRIRKMLPASKYRAKSTKRTRLSCGALPDVQIFAVAAAGNIENHGVKIRFLCLQTFQSLVSFVFRFPSAPFRLMRLKAWRMVLPCSGPAPASTITGSP